jgi:hypothetical protein
VSPGADRPATAVVTPGEPPAEIVAVLVAAVEAAWPRPEPVPADSGIEPPGAWRFSGRWWSVPVPARRDRPWAGR